MKNTPSNINFIFIVVAVVLLIIGFILLLSDEVILVDMVGDPDVLIEDHEGNSSEIGKSISEISEVINESRY